MSTSFGSRVNTHTSVYLRDHLAHIRGENVDLNAASSLSWVDPAATIVRIGFDQRHSVEPAILLACSMNHNTPRPDPRFGDPSDMTATDFRRFTLSCDGTQQGSHGCVDEPASSAASLMIIVTSRVLAVQSRSREAPALIRSRPSKH